MSKNLDYTLYTDIEELVKILHSHNFRVGFSIIENIKELTKKIKKSKDFDKLKGYDKDFIRSLYTKSYELRDLLEQRRYDINRPIREETGIYERSIFVKNENCILNLEDYNNQLQFPNKEDKTSI